MKTDLFNPTKTKKQQLLEWIKLKHWVRTSEILRWSTENYSNRAMRNARQLHTEGKIKRMPKDEALLKFGSISESVWVYIDKA